MGFNATCLLKCFLKPWGRVMVITSSPQLLQSGGGHYHMFAVLQPSAGSVTACLTLVLSTFTFFLLCLSLVDAG